MRRKIGLNEFRRLLKEFDSLSILMWEKLPKELLFFIVKKRLKRLNSEHLRILFEELENQKCYKHNEVYQKELDEKIHTILKEAVENYIQLKRH